MKIKETIKRLLPYIIMLFASFAACYIIAWPGLNYGSDINFHIANIIDDYKSLKNGYYGSISHYLANGLGYGKRLFYSPLSHLSVALMMLLIENIGLGLIEAYKIVIFLSIFISGVFTYIFLKKLTKQNYVGSLIGALIYILAPYRIFDFFCRAAFAEGLAFSFIPLFFSGLYDITHFDEKVKLTAFAKIIIGGSITYLTHNITGFYAFVFGIIFLLCNIKGVIKGFKMKYYIPIAMISVLLLIGISSIAVFSQLELLSLDYYLVSKPSHMWTDIDNIRKHLNEALTYSGLINMAFLNGAYRISYGKMIIGIISYTIYTPICLVTDYYLKKLKGMKYFHNLITFTIGIVFTILFNNTMEGLLGFLIAYGAYMYISFMIKDSDEPINTKWYKEPILYYFVAMIIFCFVMMESDLIWQILPPVFLDIQFPWRLWTYVSLFTALLVGFIFSYLNKRKMAQIVGVCLAGLVMVLSETNIEKMLKYQNDQSNWIFTIDEDYYFTSGISIGFNKEYAPVKFYDEDKGYNSESYFKIMRYKIRYNFNQELNYSYEPRIIEGDGDISNIIVDTPNYTFNINTTENDNIIQVPLLYYPGYIISVLNIDSNEYLDTSIYELDGLLGFTLDDTGKYEIKIDYEGTTLRKVSYILCPTCSVITLSMLLFDAYLIIKKKKEKRLCDLVETTIMK